MRLLNHGYTSTEIADMFVLPPEIGNVWFNRGYYGTVKHDAKSVCQRYMGKKFLEYMGGAKKVIVWARKDFERGEYLWVAQVMTQVVFSGPDNRKARELCADATVKFSKATLNAIQLKEATIEQKIKSGDVKITGKKEAFGESLSLLDTFPFWFNIVTP